jgi:L-serine deaminase
MIDILINGQRCYQVKVRISMGAALKDQIIIRHSTLGKVTILLAYEKVTRMCLYCGVMGHEAGQCMVRARVARLKRDEQYRDRLDMQNILEVKLGAWMCNPNQVPRDGCCVGNSPT